MQTEPAPTIAAETVASRIAPFLVLALLALPDLFAPPISPTILRQTQTFAQTVHFVAAGFSPAGLTIDINGTTPFRVVYEFPLYHAIVGSLFVPFGPSFFVGKLVSLVAALAALGIFLRLVKPRWGHAVALRAGLVFAACPIGLLLGTAFQPDALALALALLALVFLRHWHERPSLGRWLTFSVALLAAGLAKFTLLVPFLPLIAVAVVRRGRSWQVPALRETLSALVVFLIPFVGWYVYRRQLMEPTYLVDESRNFFVGDLRRFLHAGYYAKPAFILGAMVACGAGVMFFAAGLRRLDRIGWLLVAGAPLFYLLLPTAAEQTYYAYALLPAFALIMGRGVCALEQSVSAPHRRAVQLVCAAGWLAGFVIAAPYTLRHDRVTLTAAQAVRDVSERDDLLFVLNMHDRGVGIGAFNPSIVTLAERRGWNVDFQSPDPAALRQQVERRRGEGARWIVATWFTPALDPWFAPLLPASFSRSPRFAGAPVDGAAIVAALAHEYSVVRSGANFAVLQIGPDSR